MEDKTSLEELINIAVGSVESGGRKTFILRKDSKGWVAKTTEMPGGGAPQGRGDCPKEAVRELIKGLAAPAPGF